MLETVGPGREGRACKNSHVHWPCGLLRDHVSSVSTLLALYQMLRCYSNLCILRVRMPISDDLTPRNFITKIIKYEKVRRTLNRRPRKSRLRAGTTRTWDQSV